MSKKMGLLSLLVSTTVLSTSIKAEGVTVTNSSDVAITQDTELLTSSDGSMNVFMEEPQTETSTSATDMSSSDTTMSSSVSEAIVDTVGETTLTETEVIVSEEEDVIVSEEAPNTTQIVNEPIVTQVEEPVATADVLFESENGEISEISLEPMIVDVKDDVNTTEEVITDTIVKTTEVEITEAIVDQISEPVVAEQTMTLVTEQTMTPTNVDYVPQTTVVAQTVPTIYKEIEQVENKPIGTLKRLGVSDPSKPIGKLTRLMQILPETGSLNGDTSIITGVVMLMSAIILFLYGFAKRIFN